ncbi:MAG: heparinase II/III domain-containing protein [Solirubrobacterales bacterium]
MHAGGRRAAGGRWAIVVAGLLSCALVGALWAAPASAAPPDGEQAQVAKPQGKGGKGKKGKGKRGSERRAAGQLKRAGCPAYRAIEERKYSSKVRRAAQRSTFEIFHFKTRLKPPINWEKDTHGSRSFRQNLHGFLWMDVLMHSYKRTGNETVLRQARDLALDWVKSNPRQFKPGRRGFAWHPKAVADRAGYLGYVTRTAACKGLLNRKQGRLLLRSLNAHGRYLANTQQHQESNFGLFQDIGLLLLSEYVSFEAEAPRWRALAMRRFPETLLGRLTSEPVWLEHSTQYQFLAIRLLRDFLRFKPDEKTDPFLKGLLAQLKDRGGWFVAPDGTYALLGDTQLGKVPEWGYYRDRTYNGLKTFGESGFAFARQGGSYLATTAGFHNLTHKHADELDFELFDRGLQIINGPGNYGYDREEAYRDYQLSSPSHSVLIADGQSFAVEPQNVYGSGITATGQGSGWFAIHGTNPLLSHQGVGHSRLFLYRPGHTLIVVDRVRAPAPHTYHRFFQLGSKIQIQGRGPGELGLTGPGFTGALYDDAAQKGDAGRALVRGRKVPLQGFVFPGFRQAVPRWSVEYVTTAANADFITTFTLDGATQRARLTDSTPEHFGIHLDDSDGPDSAISVTKSGDQLSVGAVAAP